MPAAGRAGLAPYGLEADTGVPIGAPELIEVIVHGGVI